MNTDDLQIKDNIMLLVNDKRTTSDICEYLYGPRQGPDNPAESWEKVRIAVNELIQDGLLYMKYDGTLLDLWR